MTTTKRPPAGPITRTRWRKLAGELQDLADAVEREQISHEAAVSRASEVLARECLALPARSVAGPSGRGASRRVGWPSGG